MKSVGAHVMSFLLSYYNNFVSVPKVLIPLFFLLFFFPFLKQYTFLPRLHANTTKVFYEQLWTIQSAFNTWLLFSLTWFSSLSRHAGQWFFPLTFFILFFPGVVMLQRGRGTSPTYLRINPWWKVSWEYTKGFVLFPLLGDIQTYNKLLSNHTVYEQANSVEFRGTISFSTHI